MDILPNEVESISVIGDLNGGEVKLVKTAGGYFIAVGKKGKYSEKAEALAVGSHEAIVKHQICKQHGDEFKPIIMKSEHETLENVEDKTSFLSKNLIDNGIELYLLSKNNNLDFILYKHG